MVKRSSVLALVACVNVAAAQDAPIPGEIIAEVACGVGCNSATRPGEIASHYPGVVALRWAPDDEGTLLVVFRTSPGNELALAEQMVLAGDVLDAEQNSSRGSAETTTQSFFVQTIPADYLQQTAITQVRASAAHAHATGVGLLIAILDTGIAPHPALEGRIAPGGWNFLHGNANTGDLAMGVDTNGNGRADEMLGHGTFVAGLATLIAPDARVLPVRVFDSDGRGDVFSVAAAIRFAADQGARVINVSAATMEASNVLERAVAYAAANGALIVAAGGNSHLDTTDSGTRIFPARYDDVIGVASLNANDTLSGFSNYGGSIDLCAPGSGAVSLGVNADYVRAGGTSFSTGIVAGIAALVRERFPADDPIIAQLRIIQSCVNIDAMNPAFAGLMGAGRVDALRAVSLCIADFDQDGSLDFFDYDAFVGAFELGTEAADFNHDGSVDFFDYDHFVGTFESGC